MSGRMEAERIIARWEWRMIHSPQGAIALREKGVPDADDQVRALGEQATEEMRSAQQAARREPARRVEEIDGRVKDLERQLGSLGVSDGTPVFGSRTDMLPRTSTLIAMLLTVAIAAAAAFAAGSFLGLSAPSTYAPEVAMVILAALIGGIAGDALTHTRTSWAIGIAVGATALGAISAYLVSWVAGLMPERRLLISAVFVIVAVSVGTTWALRALSRRPREEESQEVAIARRVAGLGTARAELNVARTELEGVDGEWTVYLEEVEALCRRAAAVGVTPARV